MIVAHIPPFSNIPIDVEQVHEFILIFLSLDQNLLMLVGPSLGPFFGVCFSDPSGYSNFDELLILLCDYGTRPSFEVSSTYIQ